MLFMLFIFHFFFFFLTTLTNRSSSCRSPNLSGRSNRANLCVSPASEIENNVQSRSHPVMEPVLPWDQRLHNWTVHLHLWLRNRLLPCLYPLPPLPMEEAANAADPLPPL